ncbi:helix-turn-helix transcriptional regulator [Oscillatoria sp. FACHB-1406]|uniref:helix-turn-helix domain-containing protein n=1 Tax=Oscillatoria sp. FACHB-1406 TaxID=2692846 RepID=UPI001685B98B|nr:helix-turn-helix transcriptional regulator [Oscillatoria sp. FACHB-1406]MBD2576570.1 helix-turn-helix transcriptional regulator [Oscillatoria sp. FACHB-1406]
MCYLVNTRKMCKSSVNKIKELRQAHNLTQIALAEKLKTTQQTVQRWESGKTNIPSSGLKDLAIILNCSVDEILGLSEISRTFYPAAFVALRKNAEEIVAHHGGVILKLKGISRQFDYPIDTVACEKIHSSLPEISDNPTSFSWMNFEALNNYKLFINLKFLKSLNLYSDDYSDAPIFFNPEVYRILTDWDLVSSDSTLSQISNLFEISETLAKASKEIVEKYQENDGDWDSYSYFQTCKIYWSDGEITSHYLERKLYFSLEELRIASDDPDIYPEAHLGERFIIEEDEDGYFEFLNLNQIAAIEVPAIQYWQVACEVQPELLNARNLSIYMPPALSQVEIARED